MMDVRMPKMTGYEACRQIRLMDDFKDIPVVFLSAKGQDEEVQSGIERRRDGLHPQAVFARRTNAPRRRNSDATAHLRTGRRERVYERDHHRRRLNPLRGLGTRTPGHSGARLGWLVAVLDSDHAAFADQVPRLRARPVRLRRLRQNTAALLARTPDFAAGGFHAAVGYPQSRADRARFGRAGRRRSSRAAIPTACRACWSPARRCSTPAISNTARR